VTVCFPQRFLGFLPDQRLIQKNTKIEFPAPYGSFSHRQLLNRTLKKPLIFLLTRRNDINKDLLPKYDSSQLFQPDSKKLGRPLKAAAIYIKRKLIQKKELLRHRSNSIMIKPKKQSDEIGLRLIGQLNCLGRGYYKKNAAFVAVLPDLRDYLNLHLNYA
jgi:hypothetical protein